MLAPGADRREGVAHFMEEELFHGGHVGNVAVPCLADETGEHQSFDRLMRRTRTDCQFIRDGGKDDYETPINQVCRAKSANATSQHKNASRRAKCAKSSPRLHIVAPDKRHDRDLPEH